MIYIQTPQLLIRDLKPTDWEDLLRYRSLPEVCEFQWYDPYNEDKAKEFCIRQSTAEFPIEGQRKQFAIILEDKVIGDVGLKPESYDKRIVEFGVSMNPTYQWKGYAQEALQIVFKTLFEQYDVHRIFAITSQENHACIRLLENLAMTREWTMTQSFWNKGKRHDEYLYAILQSNYLLIPNNG